MIVRTWCEKAPYPPFTTRYAIIESVLDLKRLASDLACPHCGERLRVDLGL